MLVKVLPPRDFGGRQVRLNDPTCENPASIRQCGAAIWTEFRSRSPRYNETYIKVKGRWTYLYRAVDKTGQTIDFLLSAKRDAAAAKRFFRKALAQPHTVNPRTITVDKNACYPRAVTGMKRDGQLWRSSRLRQVKYLNNIIEQDHRRIKRLTGPGLGFGSFRTARRTVAGFEAMAMIRKGQVTRLKGNDMKAQAEFVSKLFQMAA